LCERPSGRLWCGNRHNSAREHHDDNYYISDHVDAGKFNDDNYYISDHVDAGKFNDDNGGVGVNDWGVNTNERAPHVAVNGC